MIANEAYHSHGRKVCVASIEPPSDLHPIESRNFVGNYAELKRASDWCPCVTFEQGVHVDMMALARESRA